ncbi:MAG: hypothetical protein ACK40M_05525 [Flavobacteriales bacterium]
MKTLSTSVHATPLFSKTFVAILLFLIGVFLFKDVKSITPSTKLPSGLIFRIKTERNDTLLNTEEKIAFSPSFITQHECEYGIITDYIRAQKTKNMLRDQGFLKTEIVAYFNRSPISIDDAFLLLNNRNSSEMKVTSSITIREMDSLLGLLHQEEPYFAISISMNDAQTVNRFFNLSGKLDIRVNLNGTKEIVFGKFSTIEDANVYLELLKDQGIVSTVISAWSQFGRAIPIDSAPVGSDSPDIAGQ